MTACPLDRSFVTVGGAADVLAAALGAGSPRDAARRLRDLAPTLDLAEARAASRRDGRAVVVAADPEAGAALAVRWFAPGVATPVHDHGSLGCGRGRRRGATGTSASPSATVARCSTPRSGWSRAMSCGGSTRPATSTARRPPRAGPPSWCSSRRLREGPRNSSPSTCRPPPGRGDARRLPRTALRPAARVLPPTTCSSTSTCRPGASRSAGAPRSRSCSTATSWVCPICGCARSGPCRRSTGASSRSRSAPAAAPRRCSGATSMCCTCGTGRWPSTSPTARGTADAAAIAGQDAEAPMVRP